MAIKYINIFQSKALQNLPKLGFFGLKTNHLATLFFDVGISSQKKSRFSMATEQRTLEEMPPKVKLSGTFHISMEARIGGKKNNRIATYSQTRVTQFNLLGSK
jgi:hypothetical protein